MQLACETEMTPNIRRLGGKNRRIWAIHNSGTRGSSALHCWAKRYRWHRVWRVGERAYYDIHMRVKEKENGRV